MSSSEVLEGAPDHSIAVIFPARQGPPWGTEEEAKPWTEVLDYACAWAMGENTPNGAASKITYNLYHNVGAEYDCRTNNYTCRREDKECFCINDFLHNIPSIKNIDCRGMGKALVTFLNVVGCGANYRICTHIEDAFKCFKPIGCDNNNWKCPNFSYNYHAFACIGDKVFDSAFLYISSSSEPEHANKFPFIAANITWEEYKSIATVSGHANYPEAFRFFLYYNTHSNQEENEID